MKRIDLVRHLEAHGCQLLREGAHHSVYVNRTAASRHPADGRRRGGQLPSSESSRRTPPSVHLSRVAAAAEPVSISAFAWAEFLCGPVSVEATTLARELLGEPVSVRRAEAERAAQLFNLSGRRRRSLGDCLVAAAAIEAGARLATENRRDFDAFTAAGLLLA